VVGDFGCGEAFLSKLLPQHTILSIDHIAIDDTVLVRDMANTQLPDKSLDVVVFSLSLMGTNWRDYIKEAKRVLKHPGYLRIAEPANKWKDDKFTNLRDTILDAGFDTVGEPSTSLCDNFIYINASIDPF
jgi:ubiquinone/menaquinone biosynthesis C-methylase UbiE